MKNLLLASCLALSPWLAFAVEPEPTPAAEAVAAPAATETPSATPTATPTATPPATPTPAPESEKKAEHRPAVTPAPAGVSSDTLHPTVTTTEAGSGGNGDFETTVSVRRPVTAASSSTVRERDLKLRTMRRPADVLSVTPGLFVVQHAGGGKANQYFLRGYDADHGTDVAIFVDGIPANQVSHGHGQGYTDLHWLIPELVDRVEVLKGTYFPHLGDFATAGGINIVTANRLPYSAAKVGIGSFGTLRGLAIASGTDTVGGFTPLAAAEIYSTDGPFLNPEKLRRYNVFVKGTRAFSSTTSATFGLTGYGGRWNASGQIPNREVVAGRLDRFGNIDPTEGGDSNRYSLYGNVTYQPSEKSKLTALAYVDYYRMTLFSNFTFFSADPVNGDQINQTDNRTTFGFDVRYLDITKGSGLAFESTIGLQGRHDNVNNGLFNTLRRSRIGTVRENDVLQRSVALFANEEITWTSWLRTALGARADHFYFNVGNRAPVAPLGITDALVLSPKASVIFSPAKHLDLFLNYGHGFHSNDARGVAAGAKPLNKVYGYEVGARAKVWEGRLDLAGAFFGQNSDGELVYVGDAGGTENKGPSQRVGLELEGRLRILDWLYADADVNFVKAELRNAPVTANAVPYAPTRLISAGLSVQHPKGYFGRFGMFHIGDRAGSEDRFFVAEGFTRFDATIGYRQKSYELTLAVQNVFNTKWREAQFATVSRLPGETGPASCPAGTRPSADGLGAFNGCEDMHFTPGAPLNLQVTGTMFF